jgi:alkylation response protein AidB-like acyl-CoA dehydrogenase
MSSAQLQSPVRPAPVLPAHVADDVAEHADALDRGELDARRVLSLLGDEGVLGLGAPHNNAGELAAMTSVLCGLAERCMSSAFATWAHRMTVEYLAAAGTPYAWSFLPALLTGRTPGITGMASSFRELAGCGSLEITASSAGDGYVLDGPIRWASNLYEDALLVTGVRTDRGEKMIVALPLASAGIKVGSPFSLLALESTASSFVALTDVRITEENVLTRDFDGFLTSVRPTFMVLQTALCVGLAQVSRAAIADSLVGVNSVFATEAENVSGKLALVRSSMDSAARCIGSPMQPDRVQLLALRLAGAEVATAAATLEAKMAGGKGYASRSAASRRFREAAFLPVQSPSEAQLRWELASCER